MDFLIDRLNNLLILYKAQLIFNIFLFEYLKLYLIIIFLPLLRQHLNMINSTHNSNIIWHYTSNDFGIFKCVLIVFTLSKPRFKNNTFLGVAFYTTRGSNWFIENARGFVYAFLFYGRFSDVVFDWFGHSNLNFIIFINFLITCFKNNVCIFKFFILWPFFKINFYFSFGAIIHLTAKIEFLRQLYPFLSSKSLLAEWDQLFLVIELLIDLDHLLLFLYL